MCWEEFSMILVFAITLMVLATNRYFMYGSDRLQERQEIARNFKSFKYCWQRVNLWRRVWTVAESTKTECSEFWIPSNVIFVLF